MQAQPGNNVLGDHRIVLDYQEAHIRLRRPDPSLRPRYDTPMSAR
jgi:hypothetical protein